MAQILAKDYNKAKSTLSSIAKPDAYTDYLMAVVGARTNNSSMVMDNLKKAVAKVVLFGVNKKKCPTYFYAGHFFSSYNLYYLMIFMKSAFVKYLENSKSEAAFLASEESLATAFFRLSITIEELLVLAPTTAIR